MEHFLAGFEKRAGLIASIARGAGGLKYRTGKLISNVASAPARAAAATGQAAGNIKAEFNRGFHGTRRQDLGVSSQKYTSMVSKEKNVAAQAAAAKQQAKAQTAAAKQHLKAQATVAKQQAKGQTAAAGKGVQAGPFSVKLKANVQPAPAAAAEAKPPKKLSNIKAGLLGAGIGAAGMSMMSQDPEPQPMSYQPRY